MNCEFPDNTPRTLDAPVTIQCLVCRRKVANVRAFPVRCRCKKSVPAEGLVGTEIKRQLESLGIYGNGDCGCEAYANYLNRMGIAWCRRHKKDIAARIMEEAQRRQMPAPKMGVRALVWLAIRRAQTNIDKEKKRLAND